MGIAGLMPEWERVETLANVVIESRRSGATTEPMLQKLRQQQQAVETARSAGAWSGISATPLSDMEYDVLACAIAPEILPRVAWLFQSISGRPGDPYPSLHFLQEMLSLEASEAPALYNALEAGSPLRKTRLVTIDGSLPFASVQPAPGVTRKLMDRPYQQATPPGALPVPATATWQDLVLPPAQLVMLQEFLAYMTHRATLVETWGAKPPAESDRTVLRPLRNRQDNGGVSHRQQSGLAAVPG